MNLAPDHICDPVTEVVDAELDQNRRVMRWLYVRVCAVCHAETPQPAHETAQAAA